MTMQNRPERVAVVDFQTSGGILSRVSLRTRLYGLVGLSSVMLVVAVVIGLGARSAAKDGMQDLEGRSRVATLQMKADMMHDAIRSDVLDVLVASDAADRASARTRFEEHAQTFGSLVEQMMATESDPAFRKRIEALEPPVKAYASAARETIAAVEDPERARAGLAKTTARFEELEEALGSLNADLDDALVATRADAGTGMDHALVRVSVLVIATGIMLGVGIVSVSRSILRPLGPVVDSLDALSRRDCTHRVPVEGEDELAHMCLALNHSLESTASAIGAIRAGASDVADAAGRVQRGGERVRTDADAASSQTQASSAAADQVNMNVQTVATGIEEMGGAMREVARSAAQAARVATAAVGVASQTNQTVSRLGESSSEIGKVVKVITSIAQQTNLLAL
ncbi:MAG: methyl-accepting chemotaxis protein, partial [Myxococcales bacterium]|nr:methyl-accepting chemotaxis protein [Myxococcales bacterium]